MKLFTCKQIAAIDQLTMKLEPISSIDLMERASGEVADWIIQNIGNDRPFVFFVGPGNNGGDALAVARMLGWCNFNCTVYLVSLGSSAGGSA